jgi:hypothetical protein
MYRYLIKLPPVFLFVVCLISCAPANNKPVLIRFSADSSRIIFSGIDAAGLLALRNTPGIDTSYSSVLSVVELAGENDSAGVERQLPGRIDIADSTVIFTPRDSFVRAKSYQVVSYLNARFGDAGMILTGKLDHKVKPFQIILRR